MLSENPTKKPKRKRITRRTVVPITPIRRQDPWNPPIPKVEPKPKG